MTAATKGSTAFGGGYQNTGCIAPAGVGHHWYAVAGCDVGGTIVTGDGINWRPSNSGINAADANRHHAAAVTGSATVADRLYYLCSTLNTGGSGNGVVMQGTYSNTTGFVSWTDKATGLWGIQTGGADRPRLTGRLLALDEANDCLYAGTDSGIWKVTISTGATTQRALSGSTITGLVLDGADPTICYASVLGAGVYRLTNIRSGTVASTHKTFTDSQDVVYLNAGGTAYLYAATTNQPWGNPGGTLGGGPQRWTVGADITTGWTSISAGYDSGGNGISKIDAHWDGTKVLLLAGNGGDGSNNSGGSFSKDGGTTWLNCNGDWTTSTTPWAETQPWWLTTLASRVAIDQATYRVNMAQIDHANPLNMLLFGRSGTWRSQNGGTSWRPSVRGLEATVAHIVAAAPATNGRAATGDVDWTSIIAPQGFTSGLANGQQPQTGTGLGVYFRSDTLKLGVANESGEVWTTTNPFAASPTWTDNGFSNVSGAARQGMAIGDNGSGQEVLLTVRTGGGIERKLGGGAPSIASSLDTGTGAMTPHFCWPNGGAGRAYVYCSMASGLLRSTDQGATWSRVLTYTNSSENTGNIHNDPNNLDTLYLTADDGTAGGTGLFKITTASGSPTKTKIGPTISPGACGPCAVDPASGVVYVCTVSTAAHGDTQLYASPANNPGSGTTFTNITDPGWAGGPIYPLDMCVTGDGMLLAANHQGGYYVSDPTGGGGGGTQNAAAALSPALTLQASGQVIGQTPVERTLAAATATSNAATSLSVSPTGMVQNDLLLASYATDVTSSGSTGVLGGFKGNTGTGTATSVTGTVTDAGTLASGQVAYLSVWNNSTTAVSAMTTPPGWTPVVGQFDDAAVGGSMACYRKALTGSETTVSVSVSAAARMALGGVVVTNPDATSPEYDSAKNTGAVASSTTVDASSVSVTAGGTLVTFHGGQAQTTGALPTWTPPSGMTEQADDHSTSGGARNATIEANTLAVAADGTSGTKTATATASMNQYSGISISVRPAGGSSSVTHQAPGGWTQVGTTQVSGGLALSEWRKFAGSSEAGPYSFTTAQGSTMRMAVAVRAFPNTDQSAPIDGATVQGSASGATSFTHGAVTSGGLNRLWMLATAKTFAASGSSAMNTPATFTETVDAATSSASATNLNAALDYKTVQSGSTGTQAVTASDGSAQTWVGIAFLVASAAGAPVVTGTAAAAQTISLAADAELIPGPGTLPPGAFAFDGTNGPQVLTLLGLGAAANAAASTDYLHLGVGPGLGTAKLSGTTFVDVAADVISIRIGRGAATEYDGPQPGTCTVTLDNRSGNYDPTNLSSPYVAGNLLSGDDASFEDTIGNWQVGGGCTIAQSTAAAAVGTASLAVTGTGSGGAFVTCTGGSFAAAVPCQPGDRLSAGAQVLAAATPRAWHVVLRYLNAANTYVGQQNGPDVTDSAGAFVEVRYDGATVPAGLGIAKVTAQIETATTPAGGEVHYVDNVRLVKGKTVDTVTSLLDVGMPGWIRAQFQGVVYDRFYGFCSDISLDLGWDPTVTLTFADGLETLGRARLATIAAGDDGDTTGARLGRIADQTGWPSSLRAIDTGFTTLGATVMGDTALTLAAKVVATEFGVLYVDGAGRLTFADRHHAATATRSVVVQAELTDAGGPADVDMVALEVAKSRDGTCNDVHITREPDPYGQDQPAEQIATSASSVAAYGLLSLPGQVGALLRSDNDALAMAQWLLTRFPTPVLRVREVRVDAVMLNLWDRLLPLGLLDRVRVRRNYGPNLVLAELLVYGFAEEIRADPPSWTFVLSTQPPPPARVAWTLGSSALGSGRLGY